MGRAWAVAPPWRASSYGYRGYGQRSAGGGSSRNNNKYVSCGVCSSWVWESRLSGGNAENGKELKCERGAPFAELQQHSWHGGKPAGGGGSGANEGITKVLRTVVAGIQEVAG